MFDTTFKFKLWKILVKLSKILRYLYTSLILGFMNSSARATKTDSACPPHLQKRGGTPISLVEINCSTSSRTREKKTYCTSFGIIFSFSLRTTFIKVFRSSLALPGKDLEEARYLEYRYNLTFWDSSTAAAAKGSNAESKRKL